MNALAPPAFSLQTPVAFLSPDRIPACMKDTPPIMSPTIIQCPKPKDPPT